jgi:hypothetical protein
VVQGALKLILEPIFEADFQPGSFGYRPKKSAHAAIRRVSEVILEGKTYVIDFDLRSYFDTVRHHFVLEKVARRVDDEAVLWLLKLLLDATGKQGRGRWMPLLLPKGKKRKALLDKLKEIFGASQSQPVVGVIEKINPILRGWVKYFAIGHSSRCFSYIRYWVEKKIRRHLARACQRQGFGWKRWSREWLYGTLGLFSEYRVSYGQSVSAVAPV